MPLHRAIPLVFLLSALAGFAAHRAIPYAHACLAPLDTGATFDLTLSSIGETSNTGASADDERATWPETATLSLPDHQIDFSDGTHLVFE